MNFQGEDPSCGGAEGGSHEGHSWCPGGGGGGEFPTNYIIVQDSNLQASAKYSAAHKKLTKLEG